MAIKRPETGATLRNRLSRSIVLAIRNLMGQAAPDSSSLDMAAFIVLALESIIQSVDESASAWEKRDYWLKADQFRREWDWTTASHSRLKPAVLAQDWSVIPGELILVGQKLNKVLISPNHRLGEPWHGSWKTLNSKN